MGCLPLERTTNIMGQNGCVANYNNIALEFNGLNQTQWHVVPTGMFEMGYACSRGGMFSCSDASKFVFWDSFHPTEKTNIIVAKYVVEHVLAQLLE
ncbi:GDSL esterase/lipase At2g42990-like [Vicia villosa]|uniref:GDSL esterase/lipase At2g42990-like n=1 Tax=Vicia villosa TaxID=3911 RepID=UPI00273BC64C|nr:GDSL esterase/lipase At2g42990-like [Vicia villosa]